LGAKARNPGAVSQRVVDLAVQLPALASGAYGGVGGAVLLIAAMLGLLRLIVTRHYLLALILVLWTAHMAVYLAFSFARAGYLMLSYFTVIALAAIGLTTAAAAIVRRGWGPPALAALVVGLGFALASGPNVGLIYALAPAMAALIVHWSRQIEQPRLGLLGVAATTLVFALAFQAAYPIPPGFLLGDTGEEQAARVLRQRFTPDAAVVASTPAVLWLANIDWTERQFEMKSLTTGEELRQWLRANGIKAIYMDYWMKAFVPSFYELVEREIGVSLVETASIEDYRPERDWYRSLAMPAGLSVDHRFRVIEPRTGP
jgi:hypothetical protein